MIHISFLNTTWKMFIVFFLSCTPSIHDFRTPYQRYFCLVRHRSIFKRHFFVVSGGVSAQISPHKIFDGTEERKKRESMRVTNRRMDKKSLNWMFSVNGKEFFFAFDFACFCVSILDSIFFFIFISHIPSIKSSESMHKTTDFLVFERRRLL